MNPDDMHEDPQSGEGQPGDSEEVPPTAEQVHASPEGDVELEPAPAVAAVRKTRGAAMESPSRGDPKTLLASVGLVLLGLIVGAVILAVQHAHGSSTSASTKVTLPTATVPPTPVIKGGSVAATVNGHPIDTASYRLYLNFFTRESAAQGGASMKTLSQLAMNNVIQNEIVREYAVAHHVSVSSAELNRRISVYRKQNHGEKGFERWLASLGLDPSSFRTLIAASLLRDKITPQVAPVPAAHARHILVGLHIPGKPNRSDGVARARANQLLTQLRHGADFATLARKNSDDVGSAQHGGDLGMVYPRETVPPFDHAVFTLPLHQLALVRSQLGYHILEVLSRVKVARPSKNAAQQQLLQQAEQQQFQVWVSRQMKAASIKRIVTAVG